MHRVAENLHVGGLDAAGDGAALRAAGIETVVSLTHDPPTGGYPDGVRVVREPMVDGPRNDATAFERVVDATRGTLAAGERTLVHCSAGSSRSVTVAAAALAGVTDRARGGPVAAPPGGPTPRAGQAGESDPWRPRMASASLP